MQLKMCGCYDGKNEMRYCNSHSEMSGGYSPSSGLVSKINGSYSSNPIDGVEY